MSHASPYRIICAVDGDGDWYIAAKRDGSVIHVLGQGRSHEDALWAILKDAGIFVPYVDREMGDGHYTPTLRDWNG